MRIIFILCIINLIGCATLTHQATIKVKQNKVEFYSKSSQFQAKVKRGDMEAEYSSQKPSLVDDVLKAMTIREVNR